MIHLLSKETIDKIAAGEVIERPESVVKELIDNAIDSGADKISIEIRGGGVELIRVTDNGCGIGREDIRTAFLRHATSKLSTAEDLQSIRTMGFRGEALASICAVSKTELITKERSELSGLRYVIEGGEEKSLSEVGAPDGTTVIVRDLFYNVPARLKFLKQRATEASYVADMAEKAALSHPEIGFTYIADRKTVFSTLGGGRLSEAIYTIFGKDIARNLISIDREDAGHGIGISGYLGKPVISRSRRDFEIYFVNGRHISSRIIEKAIEDGYEGYMMQHRFPFTVFSIEMDPRLLDVNVHPKKMEVRFSDEIAVYETVKKAIAEELHKTELIVDGGAFADNRKKNNVSGLHQSEGIDHAASAFEKGAGTAPEEKLRASKVIGSMDASAMASEEAEGISGSYHQPSYTRAEPFEEHKLDFMLREPESEDSKADAGAFSQMELPEEVFLSKKALPQFRLIGQVFDTYWMIEYKDALYLIDQHAAHEKVNYERLLKRVRERRPESQYIYPPILLSLGMREARAVTDNLSAFSELGFEIEEAGERDFVVRAVPADLPELDKKELLLEIIDEAFDETGRGRGRTGYESISDKLASMSCKAAVKGNNFLSEAEMRELIGELLTLDNPYACPHGRPTIVRWTRYELDKLFKRIV